MATTAKWVIPAISAALAATQAHAQATVQVTVTARVIAHCRTTMSHPQSTCSAQILRAQQNVTGAAAAISATKEDVRISQTGGPQPKFQRDRNVVLVTF